MYSQFGLKTRPAQVQWHEFLQDLYCSYGWTLIGSREWPRLMLFWNGGALFQKMRTWCRFQYHGACANHHSPPHTTRPSQHRPCCPSWACLGPNFGTKLRMLSPTCIQACPSCAWAQIGASWPEFGTSYASVRPNLRPRKFDPSRLLVGPSRPASLPLCPILWVREVPVAKRLEYLALPQALKGSVVPNRTDILDVMVRTTTIQFVKNFEA